MSHERTGTADFEHCEQLANQHGWLWNAPAVPVSSAAKPPILILAHGAGAPMDSEFMNDMAQRLANLGIGVLRFEFAYMAQRRADGGRRPPNPQPRLLDDWRKVYASVRAGVSAQLAIGGKSMGGRMASLLADELQADALICLGYPFYAVGKSEKPRVEHLAQLQTPTLIVQGERDALGNREAVQGYTLSKRIRLHWIPTANHDLKPLKVAGVSYQTCLQDTAEQIAGHLSR